MTKLCLRSIRKYTDGACKVLVIDNNSNDESLEYLKSLSWIELIERKEKDISGGYAHGAALDLGLAKCDTDIFVSMHSDTIVHKQGWLSLLAEPFKDDGIACAGSGKIEMCSAFANWLKKSTDYKTFWHKVAGKADPLGKYRHYNRTICSAYRTDVLKNEKLSFLEGKAQGFTVGKKLYFNLEDRGYKTFVISDTLMKQYAWHLAHATQVLNEHQFGLDAKTTGKCGKYIRAVLADENVRAILGDSSLDK